MTTTSEDAIVLRISHLILGDGFDYEFEHVDGNLVLQADFSEPGVALTKRVDLAEHELGWTINRGNLKVMMPTLGSADDVFSEMQRIAAY